MKIRVCRCRCARTGSAPDARPGGRSAALGVVLAVLFFLVFSRPGVVTADVDPSINLTDAERAYIEAHPVLHVAGPLNFPPFHYYDEDGEARGIGADFVFAMAKRLGMTVAYESRLPWPRVLEKAEKGEIDLIACSARSPEREAYLVFSEPYLSYPMIIISRLDAPFIGGISDLHGKKIAFIQKVVTHGWLVKEGIDVEPVFVDTPLDALQAVSTGRADAAIQNLAASTYLIEKNGLVNLKVAAPTLWGNYELFFAAPGDRKLLMSIIDKAFASISPQEKTEIRNERISVRYEHGLRKADVIRWVLFFLLPALAVATLFILQNRRLKREIAERREVESQREEIIDKLILALMEVKKLSGMLPICSSCKKIRDDKGYWNQIETYISEHSEADFSHSLCPECAQKLYPEIPFKEGRSGKR